MLTPARTSGNSGERVLVNNAGVFRFGAFTEITEESFHLYYNINVLGTILAAQGAIRRLGADGVASSTSALSNLMSNIAPLNQFQKLGPVESGV
jgi:NAD(P)-dependent dehydrogenase (short-subunit alcohol dehydrogenase family)